MPTTPLPGHRIVEVLPSGPTAELLVLTGGVGAGGEDGSRVVLKRLRAGAAPDAAARLVHEGALGACFASPHLARVLERGALDDGRPFVVFEHVAGADLRAVFAAMRARGVGELPLAVAVAIAGGVAAALAHAHGARGDDGRPLAVVHRDVAPPNVLLGEDGVVRLLDFGLATSALAAIEPASERGTVPGRPGYVSPEQARGEVVDARSDVFAAGVLLFELTTGRRLFRGASDYETLRLASDRDAPPPSAIRPGYPPRLDAIVRAALARSADARTPSAAALAAELDAFARDAELPAAAASVAELLRRLRLSKRAAP